MRKTLFLVSISFLLFIFVSCENKENESVLYNKTVTESFAKNQYNEDFKNFALTVSKALSASPEFRKLVKEEASSKFDGDYDVVIKRVMNKKIVQPASLVKSSVNRVNSSSYTVGDLLGEFMPQKKSNNVNSSPFKQKANSSNTDLITALTEEYPDLQVSIPVNIENWDETSEVPTVTFIPDEFKDGLTKIVTGYKSDGTVVEIDAINQPATEPIIVIGRNERLALMEDLADDYPENGSYNTSNPPIYTPPTSLTDEGYIYEVSLGFLRCRQQYDSWIAGGSELVFAYRYIDDTHTTVKNSTIYKDLTRKQIKEQNWIRCYNMVNPNWEPGSTSMAYKIYEYDPGGSSQPFKGKLSGTYKGTTISLDFEIPFGDCSDGLQELCPWQRVEYFTSNQSNLPDQSYYNGWRIYYAGNVDYTLPYLAIKKAY